MEGGLRELLNIWEGWLRLQSIRVVGWYESFYGFLGS